MTLASDHIVNKNGELILYSGESYNKLHEEEIAALEAKATALAKQLEAHRQEIPKQIVETLQQQMETVRPNAAVAEMAMEMAPKDRAASEIENENDAGANRGRGAGAGTSPGELKEKISSVSQKMPAMRAKIEEAVARTDRVIRAIEQEASKSGEERLGQLLGGAGAQEGEEEGEGGAGASDGSGSGDGGISPAIKEAAIAGHVSVRKKWAKLMTFSSPVKFSLKDAR